ncbi:fasciclin domain-containing protein [Negadavirga shengliensis]|uniref:Fasciclin domain-containing protein n=1 Tax=Negadavirga shengliensis TaxID=1389218 RepID=A0ABV9SXF5_9BACT
MKQINIKNRNFIWFCAMAASLGVFSCSDDEPSPQPPAGKNIVEVAQDNDQFSVLVQAVVKADLADALSAPGPLTVFAPTNTAFEKFLEDNNLTAEALLESPDLSTILAYHVVQGSVPSSSVEAGRVTTLEGSPFFVSVDTEGGIWINGNTQVVDTDIEAENGIIHVLDYVLIPPSQSIAEIAVGFAESETPQFTQLVGALARANLVDAVSGGFDDNLTVFAPTDAAFEALYETLGVNGYQDIPLETLTDVLTYHVVPDRAFSQDLRDGTTLPTLLEGETLRVNLGDLEINDAGLIAELLNVHATNGVIHVIDRVLLP